MGDMAAFLDLHRAVSPIYIPPLPDTQQENREFLFSYGIDNPAAADPESPEPLPAALERLSTMRIANQLFHGGKDSLAVLFGKGGHFFNSSAVPLNRPG
jgi:hypothetical protein